MVQRGAYRVSRVFACQTELFHNEPYKLKKWAMEDTQKIMLRSNSSDDKVFTDKETKSNGKMSFLEVSVAHWP
jgi:hypothetical protein